MTTKQTDFTNVANTLRDVMANFTGVEADLEDTYNFYVANQADTWWTGLAGSDEVGTSGITKDQFIACMTFYLAYQDFLGSVAVGAADRRTTIEQARTTL